MDHFPFSLLTAAAALAAAGWIYLLVFRGGFWRAEPVIERAARPGADGAHASVVAVMPARDEADAVGLSIDSLFAQDYRGDLRVVLVDDGSRDGTAAVARQAAEAAGAGGRFEIVTAKPLPAGWTGKLWAVAQGVERADAYKPEYLWITDADIAHDWRELAALTALAQDGPRDLVSVMVLLRAESFWEKLLIPAFVFFFQMLFPFPWVNEPGRSQAAAAGGSMLVRRGALARAGGISAIKGEVIDDCALARRIKRHGAIWLGLTERTRSLRAYEGFGPIFDMVARSAYAQLGYSPLLLAATVAALVIGFLAPVAGVVALFVAEYWTALPAAALGFLGLVLMRFAYAPTLRLYGLNETMGWALPLAALLYCAMTVASAWRHWRGRGSGWKGRTYAPAPDAGK